MSCRTISKLSNKSQMSPQTNQLKDNSDFRYYEHHVDDGRVGAIADEIGHDSNTTFWQHMQLEKKISKGGEGAFEYA